VLTSAETPTPQTGQAALEVSLVFGQSTVTSAFSSSPMKLLTPVSRGKSVRACTSSFGGGLVAGDQTRLDLHLGTGARCFLGSQSSTKIYRNPGRLPCSHTTHAQLDAESLLVFAPDPVQAFADSHYTQRQEFHLESGAGLVLLDWFTSGRAACGERWAFAHFESRNDVFLGGDRAFVDPVLLSADEVPERMGRFNCLATLLVIGAQLKSVTDALLDTIALRPVGKRAALACSASAVRAGALLRVAGESVEAVRQELHGHLGFVTELLGDDPWARKW